MGLQQFQPHQPAGHGLQAANLAGAKKGIQACEGLIQISFREAEYGNPCLFSLLPLLQFLQAQQQEAGFLHWGGSRWDGTSWDLGA